jgi:DivIVA domain-containing protein
VILTLVVLRFAGNTTSVKITGALVGPTWNDDLVALIATVLVGVVLLVGFALVLASRDDGLPDETVDHSDLGLPDRPLTAADVAGLRFRVGLRGYRMADVDAALERVAQALDGARSGSADR